MVINTLYFDWDMSSTEWSVLLETIQNRKADIYLTIKFYALVKALKWKVSTTYWINGTVSNYIYHWYFDKKKKTKKQHKNLHELLYNLIIYFNNLNLQFRYFRGLL